MTDWRQHAACRHHDPDLFFPIGSTGPSLMQTRRAKEVCHDCPVREQCLNSALRDGQTTGIWGGTTETERRELAGRARARAQRAAR